VNGTAGPLGRLRAEAAHGGLFLDFDGTLSEIAAMPELARPAPGVPEVLEALAARFALVAVVTGRSRAELLGLLSVSGVQILGLYGAEDAVSLPPVPADLRRDVVEVAGSVPGARVEDKGASLAIHVRGVKAPGPALARMEPPLRSVAERAGYTLLPGRQVLEVAPRAMDDKGRAVRAAVQARALRAVLYAGDDRSDLGAFDALDAMRKSGLLTCKVAVTSSEAPAELVERADLAVAGPKGLLSLLGDLAGLDPPLTA
jgi:trehalose 6-phosphate phosphatase